MPNILNLKFKGNKNFVAFSNLNDTESLTQTWKVCTKVASYLEQGQRLENLSWRLWHLQNLIVDTDNAKSKREFKKLSKCMGDKLDKEKGRSIEELPAPDFKRNHSSDIIKQRAEEKERSRVASQNAQPGTIERMQFTFSVDQPSPIVSAPVRKPDLKPSTELSARSKPQPRRTDDVRMVVEEKVNHNARLDSDTRFLRFPPLFTSDFGPSAMLYATPTLTTSISYGVGNNDGFCVSRPTIELPLDELLTGVDSDSASPMPTPYIHRQCNGTTGSDASLPTDYRSNNRRYLDDTREEQNEEQYMDKVSPIAEASTTVAPNNVNSFYGNQLPREHTPIANGRPTLTVRTLDARTNSDAVGNVHHTVTTNTNVSTAPGGVKAECSNCGATHTPLWRRGLNDELNCNACGLYCKLHKRPRPKTMRNVNGEGRAQSAPRHESIDVMAQCYNCHTMTTPLWRKDDEGQTVCNACGLYYKLHGSSRPISMRSEIIRKRSRHEARLRAPNSNGDTPSASPGVSSIPSPSREESPILNGDSTQMNFEYDEQPDYRQSSQSELMGALGTESSMYQSLFNFQNFPGPYHPDQISQIVAQADPLPFVSVEFDMNHNGMERKSKRRRMSMDSESASEPPSSAGSYSSYDEFSANSSTGSHSQRSSMEFPFSNYTTSAGYASGMLRSDVNAFWHPPLLPQHMDSLQFTHPPMVLPQHDDSPMDYLHAPHDDDTFFSTYLHPPMALPNENQESPCNPPTLMYPQMETPQYDSHMRRY